MKKLIALMVTLTLLASSLASCAQVLPHEDSAGREETQNAAENASDSTDAGDTAQDTVQGEEDTAPLPTEPPEVNGGEIAETVLFDDRDVKITATELKSTGARVGLTLLLENNTDKNLKFLSGTLGYSANSVNGWMIEGGYLNTTVAAGKKSRETVYLDGASLALLGISDIADISIAVEIEDDNYNTYLRTGPMELRTSLADGYEYTLDTYRKAVDEGVLNANGMDLLIIDDTMEYDYHGIRVLSQALVKNSSDSFVLLTELENMSGEDIDVFSQGFSVNGIVVQGSRWSTDTVLSGKRALMVANLSDMLDKNIWELIGLGEVGKVDYSLGIENTDGDDIMDAKTISLTVPGAVKDVDTSGTELYNGNHIRIVNKGFTEDSLSFSDDLHLILLLENGASGSIVVSDVYDSMSVNGFMADCIFYNTTVPAGSVAVADIEISSRTLEDIKVTSIEDIEELEITLSIRDAKYHEIASPTVRVEK